VERVLGSFSNWEVVLEIAGERFVEQRVEAQNIAFTVPFQVTPFVATVAVCECASHPADGGWGYKLPTREIFGKHYHVHALSGRFAANWGG
jgi:hypothetical protein